MSPSDQEIPGAQSPHQTNNRPNPTPHRPTEDPHLQDRVPNLAALLCPERERKVHVGVSSDCGAAREMKVWPFGVALRGEASNHLMLRWLKTVVVSDEEKAPRSEVSGGDREGERKRFADDVSKLSNWHRNRGVNAIPGRVWRKPVYWPGGVRHSGDASPVCGFRVEREKARPDTALIGGREGVSQVVRSREGLSTVAVGVPADRLVVVGKPL